MKLTLPFISFFFNHFNRSFDFCLILIFCISLNSMVLAQVKCGTERWNVKTLSDKDTIKINFKKIFRTTVHEQVSFARPAVKLSEHLPRMADETRVYTLECYLLRYKKENDRDIHLVIMDIITGETMVAEIISAECPDVMFTSRYWKFVNLNKWFVNNIGRPTTRFKKPDRNIKVQITGVGFYDFIHGQSGMAANGREIHPVLDMKIIQ